jgi:hypothetical protein
LSSPTKPRVDYERIEAAEASLDAIIRRNHAKRVEEEGESAAEELWRESERRHQEARRAENKALWVAFWRSVARSLRAQALSAERNAAQLEDVA